MCLPKKSCRRRTRCQRQPLHHHNQIMNRWQTLKWQTDFPKNQSRLVNPTKSSNHSGAPSTRWTRARSEWIGSSPARCARRPSRSFPMWKTTYVRISAPSLTLVSFATRGFPSREIATVTSVSASASLPPLAPMTMGKVQMGCLKTDLRKKLDEPFGALSASESEWQIVITSGKQRTWSLFQTYDWSVVIS